MSWRQVVDGRGIWDGLTNWNEQQDLRTATTLFSYLEGESTTELQALAEQLWRYEELWNRSEGTILELKETLAKAGGRRAKSLMEGATTIELQSMIINLWANISQLEEINIVKSLAQNRLDEFNIVLQSYIVLFAQHLYVGMN